MSTSHAPRDADPTILGTTRFAADRAERRLPSIDNGGIPSYGVARRAVLIVLLSVLALVAAATIASFFVHMEVAADATGTVEPRTVWAVRAARSGIVSAVRISTGDTIRAGTLMVRLDTVDQSAAVRGLALQLEGEEEQFRKVTEALPLNAQLQDDKIRDAEARLMRANAQFREQLVEQTVTWHVDSMARHYKPGTSTRIDAALADVKSAEAALHTAQSSLALVRLDSQDLAQKQTAIERTRADLLHARRELDQMTITAPAGGVVLTDDLHRLIGRYVQPGEQLLEIGDVRGWRLALYVRERDLHDVRVGQAATIEIPALKELDGRRLDGHVTSIAPQPPEASPTIAEHVTGAYRVVVEIDRDQSTTTR